MCWEVAKSNARLQGRCLNAPLAPPLLHSFLFPLTNAKPKRRKGKKNNTMTPLATRQCQFVKTQQVIVIYIQNDDAKFV